VREELGAFVTRAQCCILSQSKLVPQQDVVPSILDYCIGVAHDREHQQEAARVERLMSPARRLCPPVENGMVAHYCTYNTSK